MTPRDALAILATLAALAVILWAMTLSNPDCEIEPGGTLPVDPAKCE